MSRPYKQTRSLIRLVNARWSAEGRACHYILQTSVVGARPHTRVGSCAVYEPLPLYVYGAPRLGLQTDPATGGVCEEQLRVNTRQGCAMVRVACRAHARHATQMAVNERVGD